MMTRRDLLTNFIFSLILSLTFQSCNAQQKDKLLNEYRSKYIIGTNYLIYTNLNNQNIKKYDWEKINSKLCLLREIEAINKKLYNHILYDSIINNLLIYKQLNGINQNSSLDSPKIEHKDSIDLLIYYSYNIAEDIIESFNRGMRIDSLNCSK